MVKIVLKGDVENVEQALIGRGPVFEDLFVQKLGGFPGRRPFSISAGAWFYERKHGMVVVIEARNKDGTYATTVSALIPWKTVERSAARWRREARKARNAQWGTSPDLPVCTGNPEKDKT